MRPIRVLVVDDHRHIHEIITNILKNIPDIVVSGHAANGEEAVRICKSSPPDIILMDIVMPVMDGLEATKKIHTVHPNIKILALSSYQDYEGIYEFLKQGAVGYVTKSSLTSELIQILRTTVQGSAVFSRDVLDNLVNPSSVDRMDHVFGLTERELEVLRLMAEGLKNQHIANKLSISLSTYKFHASNIFRKLGVQTRSEALVVATKNNLI